MKRFQRILAGGLAATLLTGLLAVGTSAAGFSRSKTYIVGQFTDVTADAWYAGAVKDCFELGLMSGSSATTFHPNGMFTVAEAATIAARMHHIYNGGSGTLPAVAGAWYQSAVDYCLKNGIFAKGDFDSYTRPATRAEMAGMMAAALPDSAWTAKNTVTSLPDVAAGTPHSEAVFQLYNAGVFTGSDEYGMFQPYAYITRAEVAAIAARCADPAQRKVLNLAPLSLREAPVLPSGTLGEMSNGRLPFRDEQTKLWGYVDTSGAVVVPAIYKRADTFNGGYAAVENEAGDDGIIDSAGNVVLLCSYYNIKSMDNGCFWGNPEYTGFADFLADGGRVVLDDCQWGTDLGGGFYALERVGQDGVGVVDAKGNVVVPFAYERHSLLSPVIYTGVYLLAESGDGFDVYDTAGMKLNHYKGSTAFQSGNTVLLSIKEGNKSALATGSGKITEAIYDTVVVFGDSELAKITYGNQVGLAGLNGEIAAPGAFSGKFEVVGNYARIGDHYFSAAGELSEAEAKALNPEAKGYQPVYYVSTGSNNKPVVKYDGQIVLEFYKNNLNYDEIKELGEDYFACRYNTTWYLVHV